MDILDVDLRIVPEVVVDTSTYRQDPDRSSVGFRVLERLAASGKVRLHVPFFVAEELRGHQHEMYMNNLRDMRKGLRGLQRKRMPEQGSERLASLHRDLSSLERDLRAYASDELDRWWESIGAQHHEVAARHGKSVALKYFAGQPPFRKVKARDDFPDAFILESIVDIRDRFGSVSLIAGDEGLLSACSKEPNIDTHRDFRSFLNSGAVEELYEELEEAQAQEFIARLPNRGDRKLPERGVEGENRWIRLAGSRPAT